ncbi:hypothetical protein KIL84_015468, partial [Mauremys mutica]
MRVFKSLVLLFLLSVVRGSMVQLKNGGYEDIVIAINPELPEDHNIIRNIQDMVKEASTYLFTATKQRFFFKAVKIIIPLHWPPKPEYLSAKTESYDKSPPKETDRAPCSALSNTANWLDTFQISLFLTPSFRCSADVMGKYIFQSCTGNSCTIRDCEYDQQTKLYEAGCTFVPEKTQNAPASIMYMQSLPSVVEFCDQSTHNEKATNMQNKMCNYKSTWEVIMNSPDFSNTSPINSTSPPFETSFSLLQTKDRVVCLVLDVSGSMSGNNRIKRLSQAAELFLLQIIEMDSWVGIVTFHSIAQITCHLRQIVSVDVRQNLTKYLPTTPDGGTNICEGVCKGFEVIKQKYSHLDGSEIVLLTDGEDTTMSSCLTDVKNSGSIIHTIALGPSAAPELEQFSDMTGADITKNDGIYSKYFTSFKGNSRYNLKLRVQGRNQTVRLSHRQSRALYVPGYIENGEIKMNAPRPEPSDEEIHAKLGSFNRVATGGSFVVKNVPSGGFTDVFPPCKITDLEAQFEEDKIHLSWTAPGNDLDEGQADRYIIKMSESFLVLRNTFEDATSVNTSSLVPKPAGTKESFQFKPENVTIENGTIIYFAICAVDNASLTSEVSNVVQ